MQSFLILGFILLSSLGWGAGRDFDIKIRLFNASGEMKTTSLSLLGAKCRGSNGARKILYSVSDCLKISEKHRLALTSVTPVRVATGFHQRRVEVDLKVNGHLSTSYFPLAAVKLCDAEENNCEEPTQLPVRDLALDILELNQK